MFRVKSFCLVDVLCVGGGLGSERVLGGKRAFPVVLRGAKRILRSEPSLQSSAGGHILSLTQQSAFMCNKAKSENSAHTRIYIHTHTQSLVCTSTNSQCVRTYQHIKMVYSALFFILNHWLCAILLMVGSLSAPMLTTSHYYNGDIIIILVKDLLTRFDSEHTFLHIFLKLALAHRS